MNCRHTTQCSTYLFVKRQHQKINKKNNSNSFCADNTTIIVTTNRPKHSVTLDWDVRECGSFAEKPDSWLN
uniref:Uncharacterized protein n=1 Tax=Polysiphonia sertularioides TaxID=945028 RepID=A0A1Z1MGK2_9FLOR|nr:hypothetical protein [Polysiphonia sertularioides]